jgi:hypothetical protein
MRESQEAAGDKSATPVTRKRNVRPATNTHAAKFRNFAKKLSNPSIEDAEAFKKSLAPEDRAAAMEALLVFTSQAFKQKFFFSIGIGPVFSPP